jgi:hypothetical protein
MLHFSARKEKILYKKIKIYYNIIDCRQANHGASPFFKKASSACFLCAFLKAKLPGLFMCFFKKQSCPPCGSLNSPCGSLNSTGELRDPQGELRDPQGECLACAVLKKKEGKKKKRRANVSHVLC